MNVSQVIELAGEWVELHGSKMPGFMAAYLVGGVNFMSPDEIFPTYRDVDLGIVLKEGCPKANQDLPYKGLIWGAPT